MVSPACPAGPVAGRWPGVAWQQHRIHGQLEQRRPVLRLRQQAGPPHVELRDADLFALQFVER